MNITTTVAGVKFEHAIFNASGPSCTTWDELEGLGKSESSGIMMKSCSLEPREWNPEPRYTNTELWSLNSMWLPNLWYDTYTEFSKKLKKFNKPVVASVVWFKGSEVAEKNDFVKITRGFSRWFWCGFDRGKSELSKCCLKTSTCLWFWWCWLFNWNGWKFVR